MLEDIEGLEIQTKSLSEGINSSQIEYLSELNVAPADWAEYEEAQQLITLSAIDGRMDELDIPIDLRSELAHSTFSDEIADSYDDFIAENSELEFCKIEAPNDIEQIEKISDLLSDCEEIRFENWRNLEISEKEAVLNSLEERIAEIECRPSCPVRLAELEDRCWGGYNPDTKDITINSLYVDSSDFNTYKEVIDTLIHEGRHAYQDFNVTVAETHPRHSEVASWAETMTGGKWGYWGDCGSLLGQRLYEQQSIEIDARNFANDVLDKLNLKA